MSRDVIAQLKELKQHPQTGWVDSSVKKSSRKDLMKAIGHRPGRVVNDVQGAYIKWSFMQSTARPVGLAMLLLVFVSGGWLTSVKAATNSVPGDVLYGVKLANEQVQLLITSSDQHAVLHTQFAQRRLSEVQTLKTQGGETADQYLVEAVHALESEVVKAGDALAQMMLSGDEETLTVATILDEKIGAINAELGMVDEKSELVDSAQETVDKVAQDTVDAIVDSHEQEETQQSTIALERSFRNEYTDMRSRQTFDLGRVETMQEIIAANELEEAVPVGSELLQIKHAINTATEEVAEAMDLFVVGGYRKAFEILRDADATLITLEAQLVTIESQIMEAMNAPEEAEVVEEGDEESRADTSDEETSQDEQTDPLEVIEEVEGQTAESPVTDTAEETQN